MEIGNIIPHIEALIFASDKPLTSMEITELINNAFGFMEEKLTLEQIQTSIDGIREKYASEFYPFEVRESGGGWQFLTKKDYHKTVAQLNGEKFLKRLSTAALETLAIVAYKQPITKGEIEAIRGVSSDYSIQKLLEKELIIISGRNEDMPGKPLVYSTSKTFMDYFGINSPADLPKLKEVFADTLVEPTIINHSPGELEPVEEGPATEGEEDNQQLVVGENGELLVQDETDQQANPAEEISDEHNTSADGSTNEDDTPGDEELADEELSNQQTGDTDTDLADSDHPTDNEHTDNTPGDTDADNPDKKDTDKEDDSHV